MAINVTPVFSYHNDDGVVTTVDFRPSICGVSIHHGRMMPYSILDSMSVKDLPKESDRKNIQQEMILIDVYESAVQKALDSTYPNRVHKRTHNNER